METITKVYSGRPGCMCGCQGKYYTPEDRGFKRVVNRLLNWPNVKTEGQWMEATINDRLYVAYFGEDA